MNIFILSLDPAEAARFQCDKHVVKMIVETAQLLCTAHRILDGKETAILVNGRKKKHWLLDDPIKEKLFYKVTHRKHPCAIWTARSMGNYIWLYEHFLALCDEYTHRYGKVHKSDSMFRGILDESPASIADIGQTPFAKTTGQDVKLDDIVLAYREFYRNKKERFKMVWTKRPVPEWFK